MKKSDQVSLYFLKDLDYFRVFSDLSELHWEEELATYNKSDLEANEGICWDRYRYRGDLGAQFQTVFPQHQKQSFLLMLVSIFEDYLNHLCLSLHLERKLCCSLRDYHGRGIERAYKYLNKVADFNVDGGTSSWEKVKEARDVRNIIAHNAGYIDEELHKKQLQIVERNSNLNYHKHARVHLEVKQAYILEVIEAMNTIANALWRKATEKI